MQTEGGLKRSTRAPNDRRGINHSAPAELFHQHGGSTRGLPGSPTRQWPSKWPERVYAAPAHNPTFSTLLIGLRAVYQTLGQDCRRREMGDGRREQREKGTGNGNCGCHSEGAN